MEPSSRTPEGWPSRCPVCGNEVCIEPSVPPGDAPCPHCGHLLWFEPSIPEGVKEGQRNRVFQHAMKQASQGNYDYATELLTNCILDNPNNSQYVQTFLGNLRKKYNHSRKGATLAFVKLAPIHGHIKKSAMQKDWGGVLRHGLEALKVNPWDAPSLTNLAKACDELHCGETQMMFLKAALECNPKDPDVNRLCAVALENRKQFQQAIACWHRADQARPGGKEDNPENDG
jgi:tetratricopeptide (TPR) repeat protein